MITITQESKSKIIKELQTLRNHHAGADRSFATKLGINPVQYSRIMAGNFMGVLSDAQWSSLARQTNISLNGKEKWKTAMTPVFSDITKQLKRAQDNGISFIIVDDADVGKTHAAREYAAANKYAVYVDCSLSKKKRELVSAIAKGFGTHYEGRHQDVLADLLFHIKNHTINPIVMLDEAGDLDAAARLELKALWNGTEDACAWVQIGADGLMEVVRKGIEGRRVGFTETFSRYGKKYQSYTPLAEKDKTKFNFMQAAMIIKANAPEGADIQKILVRTKGSLRRVKTELCKLT